MLRLWPVIVLRISFSKLSAFYVVKQRAQVVRRTFETSVAFAPFGLDVTQSDRLTQVNVCSTQIVNPPHCVVEALQADV